MQKAYTILTILVLVFSSACGPEIIPPALAPGTVTVQATLMGKGGSAEASTGEGDESDDEEPAVEGLVLNASGATAGNSTVSLIPYGTTSAVATATTDSLGQFGVTGQPGTYYFEVTIPGGPTTQSDTLTVAGDVWVTLQLN